MFYGNNHRICIYVLATTTTHLKKYGSLNASILNMEPTNVKLPMIY